MTKKELLNSLKGIPESAEVYATTLVRGFKIINVGMNNDRGRCDEPKKCKNIILNLDSGVDIEYVTEKNAKR